jgi:hypothetical protein
VDEELIAPDFRPTAVSRWARPTAPSGRSLQPTPFQRRALRSRRAAGLCSVRSPDSAIRFQQGITRAPTLVLCRLLPAIGVLAAMSAGAEPNTGLALVGGMPVHHAAILLENNRIVAAGPASEIMILPGTPVIG